MSWRLELVTAPEPRYLFVVSDENARVHRYLIRRHWYETSQRFQRRAARRITRSLAAR